MLPLYLALAAGSGVTAPPPGGQLRVALLEPGGAASAEDRAATSVLLDLALAQRGVEVVPSGRAPLDCGAPCLERVARADGAELVLTGQLTSTAAGFALELGLYDTKRPDAGVARGAAKGVDLNALGADLDDAVAKLLAPALALRGGGADAIREGLGWGTPGLILGGALAVAGVALAGAGLWPFVDRALAVSEVDRLRVEGGSKADLSAASLRVSGAHQALSEWGLSALAMGTAATLVGAAMMSAAASE